MDKKKKKVIWVVAIALVVGYLQMTNFFTDFAHGFAHGWNKVSTQQNM